MFGIKVEPAVKAGWYVALVDGAIVAMGRNKRELRKTAHNIMRVLPRASIEALIEACKQRIVV